MVRGADVTDVLAIEGEIGNDFYVRVNGAP